MSRKKFFTIEPCKSSRAFEIKLEKTIDLKKLEGRISRIGSVVASTMVVLIAKIDGKPLSIYASGRIMIKEVDKKQAEEIGKKIADLIS